MAATKNTGEALIIERRIQPGKASGNTGGSKPLTLEKQLTQQSQEAALGISKQASSPPNRGSGEAIAVHEPQQ